MKKHHFVLQMRTNQIILQYFETIHFLFCFLLHWYIPTSKHNNEPELVPDRYFEHKMWLALEFHMQSRIQALHSLPD